MISGIKRLIGFIFLSGLALSLLSACGTTGIDIKKFHPKKGLAGVHDEIPEDRVNSVALQHAANGVKLLGENRYEKASKEFNLSLKLDPTNSYVQFLNGLTYHLRALQSDASLLDLAKEGYELAIKFDPSNWIARYHLGLFYLDKRDYKTAQKRIADALLYKSNDVDMLYSMVVASYYANDPPTAEACLSRLRELEPNSKRVLRASTVVMAALDHPDEARQYLGRYQGMADDAGVSEKLRARLKDWKNFYLRYGKIIRAKTKLVDTDSIQANVKLASNPENAQTNLEVETGETQDAHMDTEEKENMKETTEEAESDEYRMVIVDVVIIRTEENVTTRKGVNLLNGLTLQFGPYSRERTQTRTTTDDTAGTIESTIETAKTITSLITIPALTYSLNIFNSLFDRSEILARPTLLALNGQTSEFFAGTELQASAVGAGEGASVEIEKEIGVKLVITPEFLEDGRIKLAVEAKRTFLKTPSVSVTYPLMVETSKTSVNANVAMNFGETLILSGLSEKETERKRDGVPFLQDIPIIQYFFSRKDTQDFQKSVLILISPRRPEYVYRETGKVKGKSDQGDQGRGVELSELQARYSDWFKPYPNWASVFHHLQGNTLYREFRTGDVTLERWENKQTLRNRLKQALGFLYY